MDVPAEPLQPGTTFEVRVYVDQKAARVGEDTVDVIAEVGSQVEIQLVVSEHFYVNGSAISTMTVTGAPRSATVLAVTSAVCYRLEKAAFQEIIRRRPELAGPWQQLIKPIRAHLRLRAYELITLAASRAIGCVY